MSSVNGWYVFAGLEEPAKLPMAGLDNKSIQSNMLEGREHTLWFSTYNRIIRFDQSSYKMTPFALVSATGDTLNSDYYVFRVDTIRNKLWAKQGSNLFLFDTEAYTSQRVADSVSGRRVLNCDINGDPVFLSYYYTITPHIVYANKDQHIPYKRRSWLKWPEKCMANDIAKVDERTVLIASSKGLFLGDIITGELIEILSEWGKNGVTCLQECHQDSWLVSFKTFGLKWLDWNKHTRTFSLRSFSDNLDDQSIQRIVKDQNGNLFLVAYEKHIYFGNPLKRKFIDINIERGESLHSTRFTTDQFASLIKSTDISSHGTPMLITSLLEIYSSPPYVISYIKYNNRKPTPIPHPESRQLYRYFRDEQGNIYGSFLGIGLYQLQKTDWSPLPFPGERDTIFNSFYRLNSGLCLASINQERIVMWSQFDPDSVLADLTFSGDIHNFLSDNISGKVYAATDKGILTLDLKTEAIQLIEATRDIPCTCIVQDGLGSLWFSSSSLIYKYEIQSGRLRQFDRTDGVAPIPYWSGKCEKITSDSLIFFYPGGVTVIIPSRLRPLDQACALRFSNFKVNDVLHSNPALLQYEDRFNTTYAYNELKLDIQAVDLSDPSEARLQYILEGYDRDWEISEGPLAQVRYPNLPPGHYILHVKGANADGVWNADERRIFIYVDPPFWQKWWFVSLTALALLGVGYWILRSSFKRKLERKNQLLREQALIIEKQQAIERERTRIASEMHDDLGSGLTTIRYLSDKALMQAKDPEELEQIQRIADHSNTLVQNMSEIIWAMNSRYDDAENLVGYLRRYASEYLDEHQIPLEFDIDERQWDEINVGGEVRRNLFLVFKEILHNTVKYSGATQVIVRVDTGDQLTIRVTEIGGKGFDPAASEHEGNGLYNCRKRMDFIKGRISFERTPEAMHIIFSAPLIPTA